LGTGVQLPKTFGKAKENRGSKEIRGLAEKINTSELSEFGRGKTDFDCSGLAQG